MGDLNESALLQRIFPRLAAVSGVVVGPGDDAAVIHAPDGRTVLSIDTLVEDHDFRLHRASGFVTTGYDVGWKAAAQNLSDINAMGAQPTSLVVSLTLPKKTPVAWVEDLADGFSAAILALGAEGCGIVGGDLGAGPVVVVTAAVTGSLDGRKPVLRSGAQPGDVIALAGTVGRAAAGLALLEANLAVEALEETSVHLIHLQCRPEPPLAAGPAAGRAGVHAMIDISDGLLRDANRVAAASGVAIDLDPVVLERLADPLRHAAQLLRTDPLSWVLGGGEDYGLLASFDQTVTLPAGFIAVGSVSAGAPRVRCGSLAPAATGWDHFAD